MSLWTRFVEDKKENVSISIDVDCILDQYDPAPGLSSSSFFIEESFS